MAQKEKEKKKVSYQEFTIGILLQNVRSYLGRAKRSVMFPKGCLKCKTREKLGREASPSRVATTGTRLGPSLTSTFIPAFIVTEGLLSCSLLLCPYSKGPHLTGQFTTVCEESRTEPGFMPGQHLLRELLARLEGLGHASRSTGASPAGQAVWLPADHSTHSGIFPQIVTLNCLQSATLHLVTLNKVKY